MSNADDLFNARLESHKRKGKTEQFNISAQLQDCRVFSNNFHLALPNNRLCLKAYIQAFLQDLPPTHRSHLGTLSISICACGQQRGTFTFVVFQDCFQDR
jgi:hypothetical protein